MIITERLRREFLGILALVAAIIGALRAYREYKKALNAVEVLEAQEIKDPVNAWIWDVTHRSTLSYSEALSIYEYLSEFSAAFKQTPKEITEIVIKAANYGYTADMIIQFLKLMDTELDRWAREKLSMRQ